VAVVDRGARETVENLQGTIDMALIDAHKEGHADCLKRHLPPVRVFAVRYMVVRQQVCQ
jgi:hypothetical protein